MASNSGVTLAKAWVTIIPTTEGAESAIESAIVPAAAGAGAAAGAKSGAALAAGMSRSLAGAGAAMTAGVTLPLVGITRAAVEVGEGFESSMQNVAALSGATGDDLRRLEETARAFGSSTKFSASEAADALGYMALAGWDTAQMTEGLGGVLDLAAASGMGLAESSDMVTDYLSAFGMEASQSAYFADLLAFAQANSNTSAAQLGEAYRNCAASLNAAGQDVETVTSLLGMLANQGVKGSEAGTQLSAIMRDITAKMQDGTIAIGATNVAVTDSSGNFRDLTDILADVEAATNGMGDAERATALSTTFTADSTRGLNAILNAGVADAAAFEQGLRTADGAAAQMAATMGDSLEGRMANLNSAVQECALQLFETLAPVIITVVESVTEAVRAFSSWWGSLDQGTQQFIVGAAAVAAALGPVLLAVGGVIAILPQLAAGLGIAKTAITGVTTAFRLMGTAFASNPIGLVITIIAMLVAAFIEAWNTSEEFRDTVTGVFEAIWSVVGPIVETISGAVQTAWEFIGGITETIWGGISGFLGGVWDVLTGNAGEVFSGIGETIGGAWEGIKGAAETAWDNITGFLGGVWEGISGKANEVFSGIGETIGGAWDTIKGAAQTAWDNVTGFLGDTWDRLNSKANEVFEGGIAGMLGRAWDGIKGAASSAWDNITGFLGGAWDNISSKASDVFSSMGIDIGGVWDGIKSTASTVWNGIKDAIANPIETAKGLVDNAIGFISGLFSGANFQLPHINLPHFSISGGFSLNPLSVPHLAIDWYAKGGVFDGPSVIGVGEAGPEAVVPLAGRAMEPYAAAVADIVADRVGAVSVEIHDCQFAVRQESDIDAIARAISARVGQQSRGRFALS